MTLLNSLARGSSTWMQFPMGVDAFLCRGASDGPLAVITAGVHGDEYEGPAAVALLARRLRPEAMRGSVILIPVANPLAFAAARRTTPDDGLNLARTFPGKADGTVTEQLAAFLFETFARPADYLIDLHSGGVEYIFLPLAGFYGEPVGGNRSFEASHRFGLSVLWRLPETRGVLSYESWCAGVTAIGAEYLGAGQLSVEGASRYAGGVLSCLAHWGICPEEEILWPAGTVANGDWLLAGESGIFESFARLGQTVSPGEHLAEIRDVRGRVLEAFSAPAAGTILALRSKAYITKGDWAVLVAAHP